MVGGVDTQIAGRNRFLAFMNEGADSEECGDCEVGDAVALHSQDSVAEHVTPES